MEKMNMKKTARIHFSYLWEIVKMNCLQFAPLQLIFSSFYYFSLFDYYHTRYGTKEKAEHFVFNLGLIIHLL